MEKLTLEHLAPYLPYSIKVKDTRTDLGNVYQMHSRNIMELVRFQELQKPILRPLSDLTKEVTIKGKTFIPIIELAKEMNFTPKKHLISLEENTAILQGERYHHPENGRLHAHSFFEIDLEDCNMDYGLHYYDGEDSFFPVNNQLRLYNLLFKWHFDVSGLIEKGLAIDINTL